MALIGFRVQAFCFTFHQGILYFTFYFIKQYKDEASVDQKLKVNRFMNSSIFSFFVTGYIVITSFVLLPSQVIGNLAKHNSTEACIGQ